MDETPFNFASTFLDIEELYRPDGKTVADIELALPTTTTTTTTLPDAPPLNAGEAVTLFDTGEVRMSRIGNTILLYGGGELLIDSAGVAERIGSGPAAVIAPEGSELIVWKATYKEPETGWLSSGPRLDASYVVDGRTTGFELRPGTNLYGIVVDKQAESREIELLVDGEVLTVVGHADLDRRREPPRGAVPHRHRRRVVWERQRYTQFVINRLA